MKYNDYRLPFTDYRLTITDYRLPFTDYRLPFTDYRLLFTDYRLTITVYRLTINVYRLPFNENKGFRLRFRLRYYWSQPPLFVLTCGFILYFTLFVLLLWVYIHINK